MLALVVVMVEDLDKSFLNEIILLVLSLIVSKSAWILSCFIDDLLEAN